MLTISKVDKEKPIFERTNQQYQSYDGIYIFGGKNKFGKPTNKLIRLVITPNNNTAKVEFPDTVGIIPMERYGHSMHFIQKGLNLVIYGGRNDSLYSAYGKTIVPINSGFSRV